MINRAPLLVTITLFIFFQTSFAQDQNLKNTEKQNFKTLSELAHRFYDQKNIDTALIYSKKALIQAETEFGKDTNYCNTLTFLSDLNYTKGNYKKSIEYNILEIEVRKNIQGEKHPQYATALYNLGMTNKFLGNYSIAEPLYLECIKIRKDVLGENNNDYASSLNNLGSLYKAMGNYSGAEVLYLEVSTIRKKLLGEKHPDYATTLNNLAALYELMGNYPKSEFLYLESLKIRKHVLGEKHPDYANSLNNLALLYTYMGKYSKAEAMCLEAIKIKKEVLGEKHRDYVLAINNLAGLYNAMENYVEAKKLLIEVLKINKEILGEKQPNYSASMSNLAGLCKTMGNYAEAETLYIQSLKIRGEALGGKHPEYATVLNNLAVLYVMMNKREEAEPLFLEAISITNENIKKDFISLSEKEKEFYFSKKSRFYSFFYSFAKTRKKENPGITQEVYNSIIKNKGLLLKSSTAMRSAILKSSDTLLISKYNKWLTLNKELTRIYSTEVSKRKQNPEILEKQANDLEKELVKSSQIFSDVEKLQNLNWRDVQKSLKPKEAAIEFIHFAEGKRKDTITYCALLITQKSKYPEMIELFYEKELIKLLGNKSETNESYITGMYGKRTETNSKLYDLIWKPIEKSLTGIKVIYYSPSGLLHKVSFAAISKSKDNYLCANYRIELMGSTSKVALPETFDFNTLSSSCVFGDIQYDTPKTLKDTSALLSWPYLEGTKTEAEKVVSILKANNLKVDYVYGKNATEAEFKSMAPNSNVVHIATHGFFFNDPDEFSYAEKQDSAIIETRAFRGGTKAFGINNFITNKNPLMRSGLAFAGANEVWVNDHNTNKEDGVLTAQEVTGMDLRKINLMVLSACETGLGDIKGTEGVYGLQRSFKMAGVKYIIMSLWQVPDAETVEFMAIFYSKFSKNKDLKLSFYEAQKEMRKKYDPFYWAAFVLME
ncbi:MAG: CHAT domain-containing protein [Bacteroidota bacterium]|nr:CHAT domain-containing protein [Bacteroidota bacterium]